MGCGWPDPAQPKRGVPRSGRHVPMRAGRVKSPPGGLVLLGMPQYPECQALVAAIRALLEQGWLVAAASHFGTVSALSAARGISRRRG